MGSEITCPTCGHPIGVIAGRAGGLVICSNCNRSTRIPSEDGSVPPEADLATAETAASENASLLDQVESQLQQLDQDRSSVMSGLIYLLISVFVFVGISKATDFFENLALIVVALFIHELGHVVAMKICGYKNVRMLFIPALGAVVSGRTAEPDGGKAALVSLAGPTAGILIGIAVGVVSIRRPELTSLHQFARISIFLNLFNLLPFFPLDGGHVLQSMLFGRFPRARWVFQVITSMVLLALAIQLKEYVFGFFAFVILMSIAATRNEAKLVIRLREMMKEDSTARSSTVIPRSYLAAIVSDIRPLVQRGYGSEARKIALVAQRIWTTTREKIPGLAATCGIGLMYAVAIVIGLVALITVGRTVRPATLDSMHRFENGEYNAVLVTADSMLAIDGDDLDALVLKAMASYKLHDFEASILAADRALAIDSNSLGALSAKALSLYDLGRYEEAEPQLKRLVTMNTSSPYYYIRLSEISKQRGDSVEALGYAEQAYSMAPDDVDCVEVLARAYALVGRQTAADSIYQTALRKGFTGLLDSLKRDTTLHLKIGDSVVLDSAI